MLTPGTFVRPSQIKTEIERFFAPAVVPEVDYDFMIDSRHAGFVRHLVELLRRINPDLLEGALEAIDQGRWLWGITAMDQQCALWTGGHKESLYKIAQLGGHPVLVAYELVKKLPDDAKPKAASRLLWIVDVALRESIARDIDSMERHLREEEWKSATVLAGATIEAILLDKLLPNQPAAHLAAAK